MELLNADIDIQGTRVYCAGGIIFFIEEWMNNKLLSLKMLFHYL